MNGGGESPASTQATGSLKGWAPLPPYPVSVAAGDKQNTITWTNQDGTTGNNIYWSIDIRTGNKSQGTKIIMDPIVKT